MSGSAVSIYEYGLQRLSYTDTESGELFTYLYDGRGSVSNLTSQSGASVLSYVYDAYGMLEVYNSANNNSPASGIGNPYGYNGEYTDPATGFQYLRSRYYNSQTGSFLTEDTYSGSILEPLSQNCYTYTGNNRVNLKDPSGHAWVSGILGKVASAAKKAASKPGAVKSGAASAIKAAAKKTITTTKNTTANNGKKNKGTGKPNASGRPTTANTKQQKIITTLSKVPGSSSAKKSWGGAIASSVTGIAAGVVRRITPGHSYINNKLFTASSAKERKLCSSGGRIIKDSVTASAGLTKGIGQAITDIWNKSMSVSPIGKIFLNQGKKSAPGIGSTVMEITQKVIKEQEEQRKKEESLKKTENNSSVNFSTSPRNGESPVDLINAMNKWALTEDTRGSEGVGNVMEIYSNYMKAAAKLEDSSKVSRGTLAMIKEIEIGDDGKLVDGIYIKNHQAADTGITVGFGKNIKTGEQKQYKADYGVTDFTENGKVDIITATYFLVEHVDKDYKVISDNLPGLNQNQLEALVYMRYLTGNVVPEAEEIKAKNYQIGRSELRNVFIQHLSQNNNYNANKDGWEERVEKALDLYYTPIS